jgi:diadenosine tetraphosphatase ApaH/serine/threonine PP2A family protein phosphatase
MLSHIALGEIIDESLVIGILARIKDILIREDNIVSVKSPVMICGDIHGQLEDLLKLFRVALEGIGVAAVKDINWVFMGDFVHRGQFSLNKFLLLALHKLANPTGFFVLHGNHDSRMVAQQYGFQQEILKNYSDTALWMKCMEVFDCLPKAAMTDEDILSMHGGLWPELIKPQTLLMINRKQEIPENGLLTDVTWSDPEEWKIPWVKNTTGAGWLFGRDQTQQFCWLNAIRLITRSYQLVQTGFRWYYDEPDRPACLINVW